MSTGLQADRLTLLQTLGPKIFNFESNFDVSIFDELTKSFYHSSGPENEFSKKILEEFLQDERSWCRVDSILEFSQSDESRFYALLILERLVKTRWKLLPSDQRVGIRDYIVQQIIQVGAHVDSIQTRKVYLNKLVSALVAILEFEWPRRWPEFIDEIVQSSKISESLSLVNMKILRILSEEIFLFGSSQMSHIKTKYLRETLCNQLPVLFNHIYTILVESTNVPLIVETLKTFNGFMSYIPPQFISHSSITEILLERLLKEPLLSNDTLSCLAEIMLIETPDHSKTKFEIYSKVLEKMKAILPYQFDFNIAFTNGTETQRTFLRILSLFFSQSLRDYHKLFSPNYDIPLLLDGLWYLISTTSIEETEIFKICIEFWKSFTSSVRIDKNRTENRPDPTTKRLLEGLSQVLSKLRYIIISHMRRPEEVIIYVNEHGEVVRQFMRDTDSINLYVACKDTLSNLTYLNPEEMKSIIFERLDSEMSAPIFCWNRLNSIGWAVGSISGSMTVDMERDFLVRVLKNLLALCDEKKGKQNKAIIASNIMYVVQQYPRFLKPHYRFLKTVVNKLFEFMSETHEGVQDMACDTFLRISRSCKFQLAKVQPDEHRSFIEEVTSVLPETLSLLNLHQLETVYEALGQIISVYDDAPKAQRLILACLNEQINQWSFFMSQFISNPTLANDIESIQKLCCFLRVCTAMCRSVGGVFEILISKIFQQLIHFYSSLTLIIIQKVELFGPDGSIYSDVKVMRSFKRDSLNMLSCFISNCQDNLESIKTKYFMPVVNTIFAEYARSPPCVRESEVLLLATNFVNTLKNRLNDNILVIFQHLFSTTLSMINVDIQEFPEHRINFFRLIESITACCFISLTSMNSEEFDFIMQSLFYGISHTNPNVSTIGLSIMVTLFKSLLDSSCADISFSAKFYKTYYIMLLDRILSLATDGMHSSDLAEHSFILSHMFNLLESDKISGSLFDQPGQYPNNISFVKEYSIMLLKQKHGHLTEEQLALFIDGMFCFHRNHDQFVQHLKDFLIALKEFQGQDTEDLFLDELRKEMNDVKDRQKFKSKYDLQESKHLHDYHTIS